MVRTALFVRLEAKPGKETEVAQFLQSGAMLVQQEPDTIAWFAVQTGPGSFAIFDAFPDERGRQAHLTGRLAAELMARASDLFVRPPVIENMIVLTSKLPAAADAKGA
jgi:quinol monooxygenase YgiN